MAMATGTWECRACTLVNEPSVQYCAVCYCLNPAIEASVRAEDDFLFSDGDSAIPGEWACSQCTYFNSSATDHCGICGTERPDRGPFLEETQRDSPLFGGALNFFGNSSSGHTFNNPNTSSGPDETRIVLIGRTGSGKSATGNTILGQEVFQSRVSGESVTKQCKRGSSTRLGRRLQVIDSPGLFDTGMTNGEITKEVVKCIGMTAPGPHAIVLVTRIDRFTKEEQDTVDHFRGVFGEEMNDYLFVLFTRKDDLDVENSDIHRYVERVPEKLKEILRDCNRRYIAFNNRASPQEKEEQVEELLGMIANNVRSNGGRCYTNEMYKEAEQAMKRREEALTRQMEEEKRRERDEIEREFKRRHEDEMKDQNELIDQLQMRLMDLEDEQTTGGDNSEVAMLRKEITMARNEAEIERQKREDEHRRRMKRLRKEEDDLRERARERARDEVEQENESALGEIWRGIKHVGKGIFKGICKLFSW